ncbi:MAG: transketolase [Bacteroidetes bacterium]|nr:transketolase [Bacteroidota bacterium]
MPMIKELERICSQVRRDILRMTHACQSGHPGGSLGCTEFFVALYFEILKHDPRNFTMDGKENDLFFLSNGHISPVWYSALARSGYFPVKELSTFRKINSRLQGHPATHDGLPGIRMASGSLGQGLSVAIGAALAKKLNGDNRYVYSLHSDGEMQEGQTWEAALAGAKFRVDNLISTIDYNNAQIDGRVDDVMPIGDLRAKWDSFGWLTLEMNGNDMGAVMDTLRMAQEKAHNKKPVMIIMKTEIGYGVDFMKGKYEWHGVPPNDEQVKKGLEQLKETLGDY